MKTLLPVIAFLIAQVTYAYPRTLPMMHVAPEVSKAMLEKDQCLPISVEMYGAIGKIENTYSTEAYFTEVDIRTAIEDLIREGGGNYSEVYLTLILAKILMKGSHSNDFEYYFETFKKTMDERYKTNEASGTCGDTA